MKNHWGNHSVGRDPIYLQPVNASFGYFYSLDKQSNNNFSLNQYAFLKLIKLYLILLFQFFHLYYQLNDLPNDSSKTNFSKLLEELDLKDNYFSVRGELVFVNTQKKEIVIKICPAIKSKNLKNKNFKLVIKGELSLKLLHSFVSLDINRDGNSLKLEKYEVIQKNLSRDN